MPAQLRQSRWLDAARVADIAQYLASEPESYVLAPLVATVDEAVIFEPLDAERAEIGRLQISLAARWCAAR